VGARNLYEIVGISVTQDKELTLELQGHGFGQAPHAVLDSEQYEDLKERASIVQKKIGDLKGWYVSFDRLPNGRFGVLELKSNPNR
jgi:hypothetical protein